MNFITSVSKSTDVECTNKMWLRWWKWRVAEVACGRSGLCGLYQLWMLTVINVAEQVPDSVWRESAESGVWPKPPPHRGKDSVAKMTWDGLSFIVSVSKQSWHLTGYCQLLDLQTVIWSKLYFTNSLVFKFSSKCKGCIHIAFFSIRIGYCFRII